MSDKDLSLDDILATNDTKIKKLFIKEWGGNIYIKQLTAFEQDKFEEESRGRNGNPNLKHMRARLVAAALCDKDGRRLVSDNNAQNYVTQLSLKSGAVLNYIIDEITKLNSITNEDLEKIAKN